MALNTGMSKGAAPRKPAKPAAARPFAAVPAPAAAIVSKAPMLVGAPKLASPAVTGANQQQAAQASFLDNAIATGVDPALTSSERLYWDARLEAAKRAGENRQTQANLAIGNELGAQRSQSIQMASDYGRERMGRSTSALSQGVAGNPALAGAAELDAGQTYGEQKAVAQKEAAARLAALNVAAATAMDDYKLEESLAASRARSSIDNTVGSMAGRGTGESYQPLMPTAQAAPSMPVLRAPAKAQPFWMAANRQSKAQVQAATGLSKAQIVNRATKIAKTRGIDPAKAIDIAMKQARKGK